jgi:hypothetical protein
MSKDQTTQQMLLLEDFHANHSALQEKEKEQMMIATSGMKLLESLPNANRNGLLEKMLKDLLTSTTAWSSDRCKLIWKSKVSKSNVLLFQLQASVLGIKGKESGFATNSNTRFSIGENQEVQTRWNTSTTSCEDVPNSDSRMRRRWGTIGESGANEIWGFYSSEKKQSSNDIRSKTIGCDDILREENVTNTNSKRSQRLGIQSNNLQKGNKTTINSNNSIKEQQTWWQTQSKLCGVPNGVSYELDKDRANRVKALGNSIVPQIARELGFMLPRY